jgi:hypothetical protein
VPMNDRVKLTLLYTCCMVGKTSILRQSRASGHLLIMCASSGTGDFVPVRSVEMHGIPPSLAVHGSMGTSDDQEK